MVIFMFLEVQWRTQFRESWEKAQMPQKDGTANLAATYWPMRSAVTVRNTFAPRAPTYTRNNAQQSITAC